MTYRVAYIVVVTFLLAACSLFQEKSVPIAKVGDQVLTLKDLERDIPNYLDKDDSVMWADDYVKKWVERELLLMKAEENLSDQMKDVSKELEEYRNSLIIFRYKNELLKQKLDTTVNESDIKNYFNQHRESFILNRNIVRAIYIKVPVEVSSPETLKDLCATDDPDKLARLNEYCLSYAKAYDRFSDHWVPADLVLKNLPMEVKDQDRLIQRNRFIESSDANYYYLVCIRDYRLTGQVSPPGYVHSQIKNLILNKQKLEFLKQIDKDVYTEGIDKNKVKLYKIKK
jgi:hypothetical protein